LSIARDPDQPLTVSDIAAWCDCSTSTIHAIERRALAKIRAALEPNARQEL
jgi:DNA-directed RNA polymerase specialized sigma24 family protein